MTLRKFLKIVFGLLLVFAVAVGLTSINHPIILKWVTGSAKHHGKSIPATVYTNGQLTEHIKIFYTDEANNYLISLPENDSLSRLKFININLNEKWLGLPVSTSKKDYDLIGGHLFQSETGGRFSPFQDQLKGLGFDAHLSFTGKEIKFNVPPGKVDFDSVRIILP